MIGVGGASASEIAGTAQGRSSGDAGDAGAAAAAGASAPRPRRGVAEVDDEAESGLAVGRRGSARSSQRGGCTPPPSLSLRVRLRARRGTGTDTGARPGDLPGDRGRGTSASAAAASAATHAAASRAVAASRCHTCPFPNCTTNVFPLVGLLLLPLPMALEAVVVAVVVALENLTVAPRRSATLAGACAAFARASAVS